MRRDPATREPDREQGPGLWPYGIVGALALVVIANLIMIRIAILNPSAPASANHYAESANWDAEAKARTAARKLGWTVYVQPCAKASAHADACALGVEVRDQHGHAIEGLGVVAEARRYETQAFDQELQLGASGAGHYAAKWTQPRRGLWSIRLQITHANGASWRGERELFFDDAAHPTAGGV